MSLSRLGEDGIPMTWLEDESVLSRFKTLIGAMGLVLGACLIPPCLVPLVLQPIRTTREAIIERKTVTHVMMLWKYKPLNQDDAL
jgi:hypothetical protein